MALTQISTAGVKDDAVTAGKIPANAVGSSELADNAVDTAAIADDAVTDAKLANSINSAIAANTAKTTNATHTGDVTGSGSLTIASGAVTTAKIADDAVTGAKIADDAIDSEHYTNASIDAVHIANNTITASQIANDAVGSGELASNAVTTAKIADEAVTLAKLEHGTSSNNGKFLRANNGADPSFETITGTTINNNADNRVITGSGTANTLEGESDLTYDGTNLSIPNGIIHTGDTNTAIRFPAGDNISMESGGSEIFRVTPDAAHGSSHSIQLKSAHVVDGAAVTIGGTKGDSAGIARGMLNIRDGSAYNVTDNGGSVGFSAVFNSGGSHTTMSQIEGVKANNTDGNYEGAIDFYTRHHNGNMIKKARIGLNGLSFQNDTADANCLDDYEEGTWTPYFYCTNNSQTVSYDANAHGAYYTKIGNLVFAVFRMYWSSKSGNGAFNVGNLPFTSSSNSNKSQPSGFSSHYFLNMGSNNITGYLLNNNTQVRIGYHTNGGFTDQSFSNIGSSGEYNGHITYYA